jgi:two-component system cell cycle sensor histidine kinase/response regulator CckA
MKGRKGRERHTTNAPRILVVDDEDTVRAFVERVLRKAGYTITLAAGGPEALDLAAREGPFDLLLTDVMMPEMHGGELAQRLRQQHPELEVLFLTGFGDRLFKEKTIWEGEAFLDKPCTVNGLLEAVALVLYRRAMPPAC